MTDLQIKIMFSREILKSLRYGDASADMCVRRILFTEGNAIDWKRAYEVALEEMPELKIYNAE